MNMSTKAASFSTLYPPRDHSRIVIYRGEKSYWRTRDRVEHAIIEDRGNKTMIVTSVNSESKEVYRTIFIDLPTLYKELEAKTTGLRGAVVTKRSELALSDEALMKAAEAYILPRLYVTVEPVAWPQFGEDGFMVDMEVAIDALSPTSAAKSNDVPFESTSMPSTAVPEASITDAAVEGDANSTEVSAPPVTANPPPLMQKMCRLSKFYGDVYPTLEVQPPKEIKLDDIENINLGPFTPPPPAPVVIEPIEQQPRIEVVEAKLPAIATINLESNSNSSKMKAGQSSKSPKPLLGTSPKSVKSPSRMALTNSSSKSNKKPSGLMDFQAIEDSTKLPVIAVASQSPTVTQGERPLTPREVPLMVRSNSKSVDGSPFESKKEKSDAIIILDPIEPSKLPPLEDDGTVDVKATRDDGAEGGVLESKTSTKLASVGSGKSSKSGKPTLSPLARTGSGGKKV